MERTISPDRTLIIETGRMAKQAAGSALVQFGDTMVLAAVTVSETRARSRSSRSLVEYREKTYAAGKIPGGFIKREGRPHDHEILAGAHHRPLDPAALPRRLQERDPGLRLRHLRATRKTTPTCSHWSRLVCAERSRIPFAGPIAGVRVGRVQDKWVLNPTFQQLAVQRHGDRRRRHRGTRS